jgi:hypothetical protein
MAGLEIAGVVLGAIPLIVSALEHYGNGVSRSNLGFDIASLTQADANTKEHEGLCHRVRRLSYAGMQTLGINIVVISAYRLIQLDVSVGIYINTCFKLLGPLDLPDGQMSALLSEQKAEAWSDKTLQAALKTRLGEHHQRYVSLNNKLNKRILLLCQKLRLGQNNQPPWIAPDGTVDERARKRFFRSFRWRIMCGFNAEKYGLLLTDIDRDIEKLSKLTDGAILLEPIKRKKSERNQSAHWQLINDQAQRNFDNLRSLFSLCACAHPHRANLRLDIRKGCKAGDALEFAFLLTFPPPWNWKDIEIKSSPLSTPSIITPPTVLRPPLPSPATRINSLCRDLVATNQQPRRLRVLEDEGWKHHVYSVIGPATNAEISEAVPLSEIIGSTKIVGGGKRITARQKCELALTLASSVLQLHDTRWLSCTWGAEDIFFLRNQSSEMILSQFYVSQTFMSGSQTAPATIPPRRLVRNEMVFALGIALLELAHGTSVSSFREPEDLSENGEDDEMTEISIANRLARELNRYESTNYARAVLRCITCTFETFAFTFNEREFREAFYQEVVVPLQDDYDATGPRP